jgi:hypothetical protein
LLPFATGVRIFFLFSKRIRPAFGVIQDSYIIGAGVSSSGYVAAEERS